MQLSDYDTDTRLDATVVARSRLTPEGTDEVVELVLDVPAVEGGFEVGQSIAVLAPGDPAFGQEHHTRLYSVSDLPAPDGEGQTRVSIAVKRCFYVDEHTGERYPGRASNFLCDRAVGDTITVAGPFGLPFAVPKHDDAVIFLVATSTGIAPFRAFVRRLFAEGSGFEGVVRLLYGGRSGVDLAYFNDARDDFVRYRDFDAFEAYKALSSRPHWTDEIDWSKAIASEGERMWRLLESPRGYVYIAGREKDYVGLMAAFAEIAGEEGEVEQRRKEMMAGGRWVELLY